VPAFAADDGTELAHHPLGAGITVVCLPGGPMQDSEYLGDLGGLSGRLRLIMLDPRGTGQSATPADAASYRCDRQVDDVEALRRQLGLDRMNLLAHSAGANLAVLYAARHPERIAKLVLVTPSTHVVGITTTVDDRRALVRLRDREPWFEPASAAFERFNAGRAVAGDRDALAPLRYGRWDAETQAHYARGEKRRNNEAIASYGAEGGPAPEATRAALGTLDAPVLLIAGEVDVNSPPRIVAQFAALFPYATLVTQPVAAHFPWLDDPAAFADTVAAFVK
jgi:proline iminopeptidase